MIDSGLNKARLHDDLRAVANMAKELQYMKASRKQYIVLFGERINKKVLASKIVEALDLIMCAIKEGNDGRYAWQNKDVLQYLDDLLGKTYKG